MSKSLFERTRLSWDAMLKITKMKLDFILYPDMYIIFEKGAKSGFFDMSN